MKVGRRPVSTAYILIKPEIDQARNALGLSFSVVLLN